MAVARHPNPTSNKDGPSAALLSQSDTLLLKSCSGVYFGAYRGAG